MEDSYIVDLFLARDEKAIRACSVKYGTRLRRLSCGIVGDDMTAEECENDTYREAWVSIPPHEPRDYLFAYLARIIRRISLNVCRSRQTAKRGVQVVELTEELESCIPAAEQTVYESQEREIDRVLLGDVLTSFLRGLPEEKRNIFMRRYWYTDSVRDISTRYHISESKVKVTLMRCREELRQCLQKEGYHL